VIDRPTVERVAHLARLGLDPDEIVAIQTQLSRILDYVDVIAGAEGGSEHDDAPHPPLRLRPDDVTPSLSRADALANARETEAGFVRVPAVLD
jgi:aspartyl-tRNA(Asn)/glutamyl-tRNA(Gln) amidotransferase subunit C